MRRLPPLALPAALLGLTASLLAGSPTATAALPSGSSALLGAGYATTFLLEKGNPLGAGQGENGQLTGSEDDRSLVLMSGLPGGVDAVAVTGCQSHTLVIGSDGRVYGTGSNGDGQLTGAAPQLTTLTQLTGLPADVDAVDLACGDEVSIVLGDDGTAYGAGLSQYGELADVGQVNTLTPLPQPGGERILDVAVGSNHTVVLGADGVVYGTGRNNDLQIAPTGAMFDTFVPVAGLPAGVEATAVSAAAQHSVALGDDGVVYVTEPPGQDGTGTWTAIPTSGLEMVAIAARGRVTLALATDGSAYGVGSNGRGVITLDSGTYTDWHLLVGLPAGVHAAGIAAGSLHSLVLGDDGVLYGTGDNEDFQITADEDTPIINRLTPVWGQVLRSAALPVAAGDARVGATLTATDSLLIEPDAVAHQWLRDGVELDGATGATYLLTPADLGARLRVRVTPTRLGFVSEPLTSVQTGPVAQGAALRYTQRPRPTIKGKPVVGKTLKVKGATASGFTPAATRLTYQWFRGAKKIRGAKAKTYRVVRADRGKRLKVVVTGVRPAYEKGTVTTKIRIR